MKNIFWEYYHPTKEEIQKIKKEGVYIFDSSSLLKIYTLPSAKRNKIFKKLELLSGEGRVWITNENCKEYHCSRLNKIEEQFSCFNKVIDQIKSINLNFQVDTGYQEHFLIRKDKIVNSLNKDLTKIKNKLLEDITKQKDRFPDWREKDPIRNKIDKLFSGKIGEPDTEEERINKIKIAIDRRSKNKKPGLTDDTMGDTISWLQIVDYAKRTDFKFIIYITEEKKDDFWSKKKLSKDVLPAPELIREIYDQCKKMFYILCLDDIFDQTNSENKVKMEKPIINTENEISSAVFGSSEIEPITNDELKINL
jgi:hypothetical protein